MPRGATTSVESNFTRGLITEFTAMNFPENAVTECDNVVFSELGDVYRRPGIDIEGGGVQHPVNTGPLGNPGAVVEYRWASVGNNGTISFVVQQLGRRLSFFKTTGNASVSEGLITDSIDLSTFGVSGATASQLNQPCQFTSGKGFLFVAHPFCDSFAVSYDPDTEEVTPTRIRVEIRDLQGVDDSLEIDERPSTLSALHHYNLFNQGWYAEAVINNADDGVVLTGWETQRDDYPSNADIWWIYKNSQEIAYFGDDAEEGYVGPKNFTLGNTPAPKGHYIYNAFNINRTNETGISGVPTETSGLARPSCIAFYAGRVFYAGVAQDGYSDTVYFSQIIERDDQFGKCYQVNDPTSETIFDLLDTDGGTLSLPALEKAVSMRVVGDALIIQGTNGHFAVRGSDNGPFRATNYTVEYVSSIGVNSPLSIVEVDGGLMWINQDGLYALGKDQIGISFVVQNISKTTIQSLLEDIPPENVPFIKGCYNKKDQIVRWLYSLVEDSGYRYEKILEFNVTSRAFYPFTLDRTIAQVCGIVGTYGSTISVDEEDVTVNDVDVTAGGIVVTVEVENFSPFTEVFKFGFIQDGEFSYAELFRSDLKDWGTEGYSSYGISGHRVRAELLRPFQASTIAIVFREIPGSKLIWRGIWDYGARQSNYYQIYGERPLQEYTIRKLKFRGKGKSLQYKFESIDDAPFNIVGWSTFETAGVTP